MALTIVAFSTSHVVSLWAGRAGTEAGRYLRQRGSPQDRIVVWGQGVRIYVDARRRSATRYFVTFPLTGYVFGGPIAGLDTRDRVVPGAWETFLREFDSRPPAFVVDTQTGPAAAYAISRFPELARRLKACYEFETRTKEGTIYRRSTLPSCGA
jgi:hypothetical protein